jgi:hypothetical protein
VIANKRKSDTKKAQTKVFLGKWFYIITSGIIGYLASVIIPVNKLLYIIFKSLNLSVSILKNIHDYINESTLLISLIGIVLTSILTSYFKSFFNKKSEDK